MRRVSPAAVAKVLPSCMLCDPAALCCMQQYAAPAWWCGWVGAWHQSHPASLLLQACGMGLPATAVVAVRRSVVVLLGLSYTHG